MPIDTASPIEQIKQKLDIVEFIGEVTPLRSSGKTFKGLCPFHSERTGSFYVYPDNQTYHCFGCGEHGDIFTFVQKQQSLDFRDALTLLAERAGVVLAGGGFGGGDAFDAEEHARRKRLLALNEAAAIWFHSQLLQSPAAQYCRSYLDSRGVSTDSLARWRLGYAPDQQDALLHYLREQGYESAEIKDAGLAGERDAGRGGGHYDYFRDRLLFPIRNARGQTIAFGGRILGSGHPKYLNTPQTDVFDKGATLYGLDLAREGIRKTDRVVIVEGYMDAVVTHQYGPANVVACIGSAITEKHIRQIKKLTRRVTLALDPDAAGESATLRGITVAQAGFDRVTVLVPGAADERPRRGDPAPEDDERQERQGRGGKRRRGGQTLPRGVVRFEEQVDAEITVAKLPAGEDPDEFARRDPEGWQRAIERATPLIEYLIEAQTAGLALDTPQGKLEATRRLLPIIAEVRDRTLADDYVGRLAQRIRVDKVDLRRDLAQARQRLDREARITSAQREQTRGRDDPAGGADTADDDPAGGGLGGKYRPPTQASDSAGYSASVTAEARGASGFAGGILAEQTLEEFCVGLLIERPVVWREMFAILGEGDFAGTETRALFAAFAAAMAEADRAGAAFDAPAFRAGLPEVLHPSLERARAALGPLADEEATPATGGPGPSGGGSGRAVGPGAAASDAAYRLKRMRLKAEMAELDALQRDAERERDMASLRDLLARKQLVLSQVNAINKASAIQA